MTAKSSQNINARQPAILLVSRFYAYNLHVIFHLFRWILDLKPSYELINWLSTSVEASIKVHILAVCHLSTQCKEHISCGLREAIVVAQQSGKCYKTIFKLVIQIIHRWKAFKAAANLPWSRAPRKFTPRNCAILKEIQKESAQKI